MECQERIFDQRSNKFIFIPFCLICQSFQAQGIVKHGYSSVITPILQLINEYDLNIVQMPCPESQLGGYAQSLVRKPKSIDKYDVPEFRCLCGELAKSTANMIESITEKGYEIVAILGIEFSPSCSIKLQYSNKGTYHRSGIFIEALKTQLREKKLDIPFIGINRRGLKKSEKDLRELLNSSESDDQQIKLF